MNVLDGPREKNFFVEIITSAPVGFQPPEAGFAFDMNRIRAEIIIEDNDPPNLIGFGQTEYTVTEGTDLKEVFNVRASRGALYGTATAIISFNTVDGSAISGADFDGVSNHRITFNNSNGSQDVDVNILNDAVIEARSESFIAVLSLAHNTNLPPGIEFDPNGMTATVTIMDDDKGELRFTRSSFEATVNEMGAGDSTATVSVGVFETFDTTYENFTFVISTENGSGDNGAVAGTDYTAINNMEIEYEFRLGRGRPVDVPITILATDNNFVLDEDKTFDVILKLKSDETLPPELFELFPAEGVRAEVVIKDNDAVIGFEETLITVREGEDANTRVTVVVLEGGLADGVEAELVLSSLDAFSDPSITAREGSHFEGLGDNRVSLSKTAPSTQSPPITIRDDSTFDAPRVKYFFVDATSTFGGDLLPQGVTLDPDRSRVEVRIVDNDNPARIGFENSTYEVIENREMVTLTVKNLGGELISGDVATVRVSTRDDSALAGTNGDYIATTREIQLSNQTPEVEVTIPIVDDEDEEPDKRFIVDLDVVGSLPFAVELASRTTAAVEIKDGDATIGFVLQSYLVLENGGQIEVDIELKSGSLAEQISVGIRTVPGDAQPGSNNDYIHTEEDLVLSPTQCDCAAVIPINLDRIAEGTERFYAVLDGAGLPKGVKLATGFERAEVAITDEIILTLGFVDAPYSVSEGAGGETITIGILSEGVVLGKEIKVDYEITINDVLASEDFQVTTGTVTFEVSDGGGTRRDVWVPVIDDYLLEGDEIFEIKLSINKESIGPDEPSVQLNPGTANLTVTDNDAMSIPVGFLAPEYEVGEASGTVELTFGLLGGFTLPDGVTVAINYSTSNDSATKGQDYREALGSGSIVLSADEPQRTIVVPIIDDSISVEGEESFLVTLTSDDGRVDLSGGPQATVNIEDDDKLTIGFGSPRYGVFESDGRVVFEIRIIDGELPDGTDITINYRIEPGSATAGDDYGSSGPGVILTAADTSGLSQITIVDDNVPEAHESFRLVLTGDSTVVEFAPGETLVEILNDDIATIGFEMAEYEVDENIGGGSVNIKIVTNVALATKVTLAVSTVAGTATAGDDYTAVDNMEVVIPAGGTDQTFNITIANDSLIEPDETFEVVLSAPYGLPPGVELAPSQSRVPVEIQSEDMASASFIIPSQQVNEGANHVSTIQLLNGNQLAPGYEVTVYYGISRDLSSATAGEDYTLEGVQSVTFSSSGQLRAVNIPTIDDDLVESDEIFVIELLSSSDPDIQFGGQKRVTIKDNDSVTVDFIDGFGSQTLSEGDGPVIVKFGVTGDTTLAGSATVAVPYTTSSGTAKDAVRYTSYYHDEDFTFDFEVMSDDNKITFTDTGVEEIGFDFEYYGQVYTHYRYEGNGYIVLSNGGIEAARLALLPDKGDQNPNLELSSTAGPLASGLPIIAPFWDTFIAADPDTTGYEVLKEGDDGKYLIIEPSDGITDVEFNIRYQIVLFENTNQIEFRYWNVSALTMAEDPTPSSYGASATIGIKDATGEFGTGEYIQLSYNAATLSNQSLIRFVPHIDYRPVAGTVILTADHPEATIEIPLVDDGVTEGDEQFTFESLLFDSAGTITITDDDPGIIEIPLDLYRVEAHESDFATVGDPSTSGIANLRVRTDPPLVEPFTLNYVIEFGSASAEDLLATPMTGEWELVGNVRLHDFFIDINNDDDPELVENFFVDLSIPDGTSLPPGYSILPGRSEVTIADNDLKLVGFDELEGPTENTQNRNFASAGLAIGPSGEDFLGVTITLHYEIENGTAIEGEDYVPAIVVDPDAAQPNFMATPGKLTGTVTISPPPPDPFGGPGLVRPGDNYIPILVIYDDIVENNETYTVRLFEPPEGLPSGFELYRDTVELTIFNDDTVKIGFEAPVVTVNENETAELSVAILSTTQIDEDWELTIGYRVSEDSALSGHDYTGTDGTLTFSANMTQATIRIPIIDDDIFEGANSERFVVTLFDPAPVRVVPWLSFEPMEAEVIIDR